jgi:hypothetical protein
MTSSPSVDAVYSLLDDFHNAASNGDFDQYFSCFHPNGRFIGTDKTENWTATEFKEYSRPHFGLGKSAWTFVPLQESRKCDIFPGADGTPAFATFDEHLVSDSFGTTCRGTGSAVWDASKERWLISQFHLSFPIPNPLAEDMCKSIGDYERPVVDDWLTAEPSKPRSKSGGKKSKKK